MPKAIYEYMPSVVAVRYVGGTRIWLRFDDGIAGEIDVKKHVTLDGVLKRLGNPRYVAQALLPKDCSTVVWPGGVDLDPTRLYCAVRGIQPPTYKLVDGDWKRVSPLIWRAHAGLQYRPTKRRLPPRPRVGALRRGPVPEISRFYGKSIRMRASASGPPHIHVQTETSKAVVRLTSPLRVVRGQLGLSARNDVYEWVKHHRRALAASWKRLQSGLPAKWIAPLR